MNAKKLGIYLSIGWLLLPIVACGGAFSLWRPEGEISIGVQAFSALLFMPLVIGTITFLAMAVRRQLEVGNSSLTTVSSPLVLVCVAVCLAIVLNTNSRRIAPNVEETSPWVSYFEYTPQTAYGIPFPYYRIFDRENPDEEYSVGKTWFDFPSLLANFAFWSLPVYVLTALAFLTLPLPSESSMPSEVLDQPQ